MASDKKNLTCANDPNFAIICTFFHKFSKPLNLGHPNIQLLQEWLEDTEEVSPGLKQLHIKLLRKLRKTVHETAWETALSKFCWFYSGQDAWEIERFGYKKASLRVKLRVLRELVESQFEINGKFRTITQTMTADELRTEPIGRDKLGHSYWVAQDPDCNLRVFQEHLDEEIWQVVATNRDELVTLINRLRGNEVVLPSLVGAVDEDSSSNSCSANVIKPPPPEERDESQDDDTIIMKKIITDVKAEQINEKIPNIKIKFDKIIDNENKVENCIIKKDNQNEKNELEEDVANEEDKDDEEDDVEDENLSESETENKDEDKPKQIDKKTSSKNSKKGHNKKNTPKNNNDSDKKIKPLIISQSKITMSASNSDDKCGNNSITATISSTKKRTLADVEPDMKENDEITVFKKARPTLLDAKRKKNISKYEKFKDDSEDEEEEDDGEEEEEEGEDEDDGEEEEEEGEDEGDEEDEDTDDEEVGEAIEEKVLIVKGTGSGKDCKSCYQDFLIQSNAASSNEENVVGDAIEEDIFYVYGDGAGVDCLVGNPSKESESKSPPKATFYFGEPGCLKLSPVKKKPPPVATVNAEIDDKNPPTVLADSKNDKNEVSTSSKGENSNNISLKNGENENPIKTEAKELLETINDNHINEKIIEEETNKGQNSENDKNNQNPVNTSHQSEKDKSIPKSIESTSNTQPDLVPEKLDKEPGNIENNLECKTNSEIEICETNNVNNVSQNSDESKEIAVNNENPSTSIERNKIPEILITVNEPSFLIKKSAEVKKEKVNEPADLFKKSAEVKKEKVNEPSDLIKKSAEVKKVKVNEPADLIKKSAEVEKVINELDSPMSLVQKTENVSANKSVSSISENVSADEIIEASEENPIQGDKNLNIAKLDSYKISENIEKIDETPTKSNISLAIKEENQKVLTNVKETDAVGCESIEVKTDKPVDIVTEASKEVKAAENTAESIKLTTEEPTIVSSSQEKQEKCTLQPENIKQGLDNEKFADNSVKSTEKSIAVIEKEHTKPCEKIISSEEIPQASKCIEKVDSQIKQNLSSDDLLKIADSEDKSKIVEETPIEPPVVPLKVVPQSPVMPKKLSSSSISNTLKPEEITKPQINLTPSIPNRKRRLSPVADHNTAHLPPEKPRRISESSETDLNSENVDGEFVEEEEEEEDNENFNDDVGGKRARFRLKIVNTDLRKKIEAQRKIGSKDTGSSSSGEDERPRKKLSPRKLFVKNQIGETSKVLENDDKNKLDLEKHKTLTELDTKSMLQKKNLTADEVDKSADIKNKIKENVQSHIPAENKKKIELPESLPSTKILNKKISPNKLADKIEFLKQSKEKSLGKITTAATSSTVIQQISTTSSKEIIISPIKQDGMTIKKRISPKKIEDKIEILKQNIEKTVNISNIQKHETVDVQDVGRARKRSSPPKKLTELSKDLNLPEMSSSNRESQVQDKLQTNKFQLDTKDGESDEEIPRKRTISEESSDLKAIIVNLNESKKKTFERNSSTEEDRSRKRTICDNQSVEQIIQQPAEKSSKTDEPNVVQPENLEFNTKKREAARKIAEDKLKIDVRNSEDDDRPKKRTSESTDQCEVERSEKFSKIQKPTLSTEKILQTKSFPKPQLSEEQILPEDLSKKSSTHFPVNKKKVVEGVTEERVKLKFPENDNVVTSDKKLKLSSVVSQSPQKSPEIQKQIIAPKKLQIQPPGEAVQKVDSQENENTKVIAPAVLNSTESEEEKSRKRTINTDDKSSPQEYLSNEIKKDKIDEPQGMKTFLTAPEKMKIVEKNDEKIKIVVKTCSVSESIPQLPVLYERIVSDRVSPEVSKTSVTKSRQLPSRKPIEPPKKSQVASVKKSSAEANKLLENSIDVKKESESLPAAVKTRHTRRAGDGEPLLELTLAQTKRKSRQSINQTSQKVSPTTSGICPPIGKKPKKNDEDETDKLEFAECKVDPTDERFKESDDKIKLDELKKVTEISKTINEKTTNNVKQPITATSTKDPLTTSTGRQQRRKREIDISNIIDTESDATPMRQSRRIAQLKIREEAERRKLEEIALKKMKEDLKRKKKEEKQQLNDDPTVVTEPSESESDYKDDSDVELKKKHDKKKKGKKSGWSSGSNEEDDHDADDDDLFKYPASDHGSPLFRSDHEFSPESEIEDESQVVPLKRARTARKEGESLEKRIGLTEQDVDESCQKCGKSDHPEWILLCDKCDKGYHCSCLSPVLFIIPEGDWFCPPCQQEQLIAALEKHLKEFDNLILSKKLEEEDRIKTLELEAAQKERQKEIDALEAAENELEGKSVNKKKSSESTEKNRRRKATAKTGDGNSQDYENDTKSSDLSSDENSDSRKQRSDRRNQRKIDRKNINRKKASGLGSSESSVTSSGSENNSGNKSSATDSDDEPIYKLRKRRQTNISYRFNDYDELINRAIKKDENQGVIYSDEEAEDEEGAGNLGRGKDISTILEADKEEKARQKQKDDEQKGIKSDDTSERVIDSKTKRDDDSGSDFEPLKVKQKSFVNKKQRKKKNRKLNSLDISSEDDGSDEDFRTSSEEDDEDDESFSVSSGSDSSLEMYKRRSKNKNFRKSSRRAARERKKVRDFVVEGSDDETEEEEKPKRKKKRKQVESDFTESDLDDDDDDELSEDLDSDDLCDDDSTDSDQSGWRPSKRKKQKTGNIQKKKSCAKSTAPVSAIISGKSPRQSIGKEIPKVVAAKKKSKRVDEDEKAFKGSGVVKKNRRRISDSGSSSSSSDGAGGRKTRGRRLFYMDDYDDEESSDGGIKPGVKRPDTPPEEREKFIKRQEEIKRMLAEKNVNKETKEIGRAALPTDNTLAIKGPEKTGAGDSLSAVPLSVIRAAKALDVDYLQRKGGNGEQSENEEDDDEAAAASAFGDDLPDDFNPDDMDEEAIAKIMEEEDFPQHQQLKALPLPSDVLKPQHKKLNTPPKVPSHPLAQQQTSVIQDPTVRKRLPMPTFHPLMRPSHPTSSGGLQHLPLLQSALTNPVGMSQPPQQLIPGVPMSHHRPPQQHQLIQSPPTQMPLQTSKPRGRRKKITPLRDPVEKAAAVAAATTTSTSATTNQNPIPQNSSLPTNLSNKEAPPAGNVLSSLPTAAIQPPIAGGNLNVAQPPQLYKPPTNSPQPSVITRMPQMPPRPRFPAQESRYYPPPGAVSPNQLLPPHHRSQSGSLRHSLMTMHHQPPPPPHHTLRPSYAGGPPPLRPGGPPLRPGATPSLLRHPGSTGPRGPPPTTVAAAINLGNGIGREQTLARQSGPSQFTSEQFAGTHRSRHPTPSLTPYRPPLYGSPGYPPAPPSQHAVGSYPPGSPYGSYYPPPSLGPPTHSSTPSNSVIIAAAAAVSAAAATTTVVVTPPRLAIPTSVVHHPPNQPQPPPRSSNLPPPPSHRPTKVTTLETYDAKRTSPPLNLQQNQPSALIHTRSGNDDDDEDDESVNPTPATTTTSSASEFSGLVSYFSSQHDEF